MCLQMRIHLLHCELCFGIEMLIPTLLLWSLWINNTVDNLVCTYENNEVWAERIHHLHHHNFISQAGLAYNENVKQMKIYFQPHVDQAVFLPIGAISVRQLLRKVFPGVALCTRRTDSSPDHMKLWIGGEHDAPIQDTNSLRLIKLPGGQYEKYSKVFSWYFERK